MSTAGRLLHNERAAAGAEFALVLPLLILFIFGLIDAGRFIWEYNRAEKATQMGARYAVVTEMVPSGLELYSFALSDSILAGNPVPTANFSSATCTISSCTCTGGGICGSIGHDSVAFGQIVDRMQAMYPPIADSNVIVEYRNVGLGYAGDPNGPDVAPMVTVRLTGLTFQPLTTMFFGTGVSMPDFRAALTLEDGSGSVSN